MVRVRRELGGGQAPLAADGDQRREGRVGGHAGGVQVSGQPGSGGPEARSSDIVPGPGGVMTDEVGVVTGELTLRTELTADQVTLRVQYREADEWYTVTGGRATLPDPSALDAVHAIAVGLLHRPEG
ncbi:hypothetical protein [Micromonospora sp. WMMD882]|uniref:hypothetical protein n=1 Tax=Micromonospora sp. WMMD882 TaxID=3015151 RepID=UPI0032B1F036